MLRPVIGWSWLVTLSTQQKLYPFPIIRLTQINMIHYKPSTDHPNGLLKALDLYPLSDYQYIYPSHPAHHYRLIFDVIEYCHLPDPYIRKRHFISNFCQRNSSPQSPCIVLHSYMDWKQIAWQGWLGRGDGRTTQTSAIGALHWCIKEFHISAQSIRHDLGDIVMIIRIQFHIHLGAYFAIYTQKHWLCGVLI